MKTKNIRTQRNICRRKKKPSQFTSYLSPDFFALSIQQWKYYCSVLSFPSKNKQLSIQLPCFPINASSVYVFCSFAFFLFPICFVRNLDATRGKFGISIKPGTWGKWDGNQTKRFPLFCKPEPATFLSLDSRFHSLSPHHGYSSFLLHTPLSLKEHLSY